jgi:NIPSNAP
MIRKALLLLTAAIALTAFSNVARAEGKIYELRTYTAGEGKLGELQARFKDKTNAIFKRLNMEIIGFWVPTDPEKSKNTLIYILAFPSREAADKSWAAFAADPEWKKVQAETDANGRLAVKVESVFMSPTSYSPLK